MKKTQETSSTSPKQNPNIKLALESKYKEETPIFYSIHSPLFTKLILKNQKNAKISNHFNKSALHYSIQFENEKTAKLLIDYGFNINQKTTQIAKRPECSITSK